MIGDNIDNPWGLKTPKGIVKKLSAILDSAVFPGTQGGPLEHIIAAKAVAFGEALTDDFLNYVVQVQKNAHAMANAFIEKGYDLISGGTDNHMMLIDLRNKGITGKVAEQALVKANITTNKNMVPFDDKSPFVTSWIRVGTAAITTRGLKEDDMTKIVNLLDSVLQAPEDDDNIANLKIEVNQWMSAFTLYEVVHAETA